ncbi:efflux RND transporter periplasmic adaptor subunit [Plebeiibacterium marinum]|uniref:Efflux RND transporter periplasmic adaptor subunit n=1 Tax=Plebeiibacterium marinum TaxID=2992111 RepID=A0AAE3SK75_9BACT|nr:efflux RND transporter periplasmic adaptor subunit [Plebeiobacterium marinum]MCW3806228.1 efflux RND transporter periplasmic adaptor subunit [Plebeiobacterium marinum]
MIQKNLLIVLLALSLFSCDNRQDKFKADIAIPVTVEELTTGSIQDVFTATGTIMSEYETLLTNNAAGDYYLQINPRTGKKYKMGDVVKKGEVIIKIVDKENENNINIEGAKLDLDISEMEYQKQVALYEKGGVTLREKVEGEKQLITARKTYENALIQLEKIEVTAPFDGLITDLPYFSQGVKIAQSQEVLQIMSYRKMIMDLMLPESQIAKVSLNQETQITNYALPEDTLTGLLKEISPAIDIDSRTFKGRVYINNPEVKLRPGMFVKADIVIDKKDSVIVISKDAILVRDYGKVVFVARGDEARERRITTGMEHEDRIEVVDGLRVEERLIIKGFETLKNRSKIKVLNK